MFKSFKSLNGIRDVLQFPNDNNKAKIIFSVAQEVLREQSSLSTSERELIAAFTSSLNKCNFCTGSHTIFAIEQGIKKEEIEKVISGEYDNHKLKPIFNYLKTLTLNPSQIQAWQYEDVIKSGFTEEQLHDAILICAAFNMYNRIVEGHFVKENSDTWESSSKIISKIGYDGRYAKS